MFNFSSFPLFAALVRTLLAVFLVAFRLSAAAQAPAWQSARAVAVATAAAVSNYLQVTATAVDAAGNVFLAGDFTNTVVLGGTTLTSLGGNDVFVAKFDPAINQFVWAQRAGGMSDDGTKALAVSGTSVYVAGTFGSSTVGFGATTVANAGGYDVFVAKLTDAGTTGNFAWAQRAGGTGTDEALALAVNGTSVYVAGYFLSPTAAFGITTLANAATNTNTGDVFVAKLTDAGSTGGFVWAQRAGGTGYDYATALAVNGTSLYVAGGFGSATAGFGPATLINSNPDIFSDVFVARLTDAGSTGSFAWAQRAGGTSDDFANALVVSGTSVYVTGTYDSVTAGFGPANLSNAGGYDVFIAKLTDAGNTGNFAWAQRAGGTSDDLATALAVRGTGLYMTGYFNSSSAGFGPVTLANAGYANVFVAKLTDAGGTGSFAWAQRAGGTAGDYATALVLSGNSVYVTGYLESPMAGFGPTILPNPNLNSSVGFLASLTDPTLTATTASRTLTPAQLFPNPAHGTATLRLPAGTAPASLTLTDALGRAVRRYPAPAGPEAVLDLQGLPVGLYLLRGAGPAQRLAVE